MSVVSASLDGVKVLLIEDTDYIRDLVSRMLRRIGITHTSAAASGADGIARAAADRFDLVVCDIGLPDIIGFDVVRALRRANPALKCMMLTCVTDRESVLQAKAAGASAYLVKPVSPRDLEAKIRSVLGLPAG